MWVLTVGLVLLTACGSFGAVEPGAGAAGDAAFGRSVAETESIRHPISATETTEAQVAVASPDVSAIEAQPTAEESSVALLGGRVTVMFAGLPTYRLAPRIVSDRVSQDDGTGDALLWTDRFFIDGCDCSVDLLIKRDPGPDYPLYRLPRVGEVTTALGVWNVVDLGDGSLTYTAAATRTKGLFVQVTGNFATVDQLQAFANTVRVEGTLA